MIIVSCHHHRSIVQLIATSLRTRPSDECNYLYHVPAYSNSLGVPLVTCCMV